MGLVILHYEPMTILVPLCHYIFYLIFTSAFKILQSFPARTLTGTLVFLAL